MELLEDEDTKNSYNESKYKVTLWEREFKKKHKRLPCKVSCYYHLNFHNKRLHCISKYFVLF